MKNNYFCIIGLNAFGEALAYRLQGLGCQVVIIDKNVDLVNKLNTRFERVIQADATNITALRNLAIQEIDTVIVCLNNFETSIYVCNNLKDLRIKNIIVYSKSQLQVKIFRNLGVGRVITPDVAIATNLATELATQFEAQNTFIGSGYSLIKVFVNRYENGISMQEVSEKITSASIFAIKRGSRILFPNQIETIEMGDTLYMACERDSIPFITSFFYRGVPLQSDTQEI